MRRKGMGSTELARQIGDSKQNVSRWRVQSRALPPTAADKIAPVLETTAAALLLIDTPARRRAAKAEKPTPKIANVPLLDTVPAGKLSAPTSQLPIEDVPLLAFADLGRGEFIALTVMGDSMDRISPEGSVVVVNKAERTLVAGKPYVFCHKGEVTFKLWRPEPPRLQPFSTNPSHEPIFVKSKADAEKLVVGRVKRTVLDL